MRRESAKREEVQFYDKHDKVKGFVPYTVAYVVEYLLEGTLILDGRHSEVGWPAPFLATFNSPALPQGIHLPLDGRRASVSTTDRGFA